MIPSFQNCRDVQSALARYERCGSVSRFRLRSSVCLAVRMRILVWRSELRESNRMFSQQPHICLSRAVFPTVLKVDCFFVILVQERLTKQIAIAVAKAINPTGVGVIVEAS